MIRRATKDDADAVLASWLALLREHAAMDDRFAPAEDAAQRWRNDYPVWLQDGTRRLYVAEANGAIVGFISAYRWAPPPIYRFEEMVFIDELYVRPEARGAGWGRQLVEAVQAWGVSFGAVQIRLRALAANDAGVAFWKSIGAQPFVVELAMDLDASAPPPEKPRRVGF